MKEEREIAGIVMPFTAGILPAVYSAGTFYSGSTGAAATACTVIVCGTAFLMHPARQRCREHILWFIIGAVMLCCGIITGMTGSITDLCHGEQRLSILVHAEILGSAMEAAIDRIPFAEAETASMIKALLTGERSGISKETIESFRSSGASHILALSGFHLGIIYAIVSKLLTIAGNSPAAIKSRSVLTIITCGIYTMAMGAGPSISRAFLFILIGEYARLSGRFRSTGTVLFTALFIQLSISPTSVLKPGFQLSYAAMAGIAFIFPWLRDLWPDYAPAKKGRPLRWMWNSASMSIACQITTGPLAWLYFHSFPKHFLLTNMIALPLSGILITFAVLTLMLHSAGICPDILIRATEMLVNALSAALDIISSM